MFNLFKKTRASLPDFSTLGADLHAHLLPGIDDGAPDLPTALSLVASLKKLGFRRLFATPHVMPDFYPNTRETILRKRDELQAALDELGEDIPLGTAAEYFVDESFAQLLHREPLLTLPGNRVLIEMSFHHPYPNFHQVVFELQMKGYRPVLAHPERYPYYRQAEDYVALKEMGCQLQVNLLSLSGYYGKPIQASAKILLEYHLIDFLATDLHHERHVANLQQALAQKLVVQALASATIQNQQIDAL